MNPDSSSLKKTGLSADPWFYALLSVFLLASLFGARLMNDFDLGYHLKGGQWILQNHAFPSKDTFTYTVNDHDYLDLHWLYQVGLYLLYQVGGFSFLTLVNIVLILLVFFVTKERLRLAGSPLWMSVVLLGFMLFASEIRFQARPEILTWLLMSLMLWVLELKFDRNRDYLWVLPVLQCLWANVEGLFALGWAILFLFFVSLLIEGKKIEPRYLGFTGGSFVLCLVNPYFLKGMFFPVTLLLTLGTSNAEKNSINEFQPPWGLSDLYFFPPEWTLGAYKLFCLLLLALFAATWRKRTPREWLLAGFFFYLSTLALRNIPLFMMTCVPLAASAWRDLNFTKIRNLEKDLLARPFAAGLVLLFLAGTACRVMTGAYYMNERRYDRFGLGLDGEQQPVRAAQFLVQNHLNGKLLNHLNLGGWLDWQAPQKTFIDGRLEVMGREFFSEYAESLKPGGLTRLIGKYQPDILCFNPENATPWLMDLAGKPEWRAVYLDEASVIYLRKGYASQLPPIDNGKILSERSISSSVLLDAPRLLRMLRPPAWKCFLDDFTTRPSYQLGLNSIAVYFSLTGQFPLAESAFLENVRRTGGRYVDLYFNLGSMYFNAKRLEDARLCIARVLQEIPKQKMARYLMANAPVRAE